MADLRVLCVEDRDDDAQLIIRELRKGGFNVKAERVETADAMRNALQSHEWDVVISDFSLPRFTGPEALVVLKESGLDIPFIIVSGTIGEETAVAALKAGAHDFMAKHNLQRLVPAVERELREAQSRRERRRAEKRLRESEATLKTMFDAAPVPMIVLTAEHLVMRWNPAAEAVFGWNSDEMLGRQPPFTVQTDPLELTVTRKDGKSINVVVWASPMSHAGGQEQRYIAVARDVTEQRELEAQFRHAQKMEAVGRLAGGVAHDFNNILTAIQGYASLTLSDLPEDHEHYADVQEILDATDWAASFTRQLLAFSRKQVTQPEHLDPNEVTSELRRMLSRVIGDRHDLSLDLQADVGDVFIDRSQLEQVIMNLVVNARDAMPDGGTIVVATAHETAPPAQRVFGNRPGAGPFSVVRVTDAGHGIGPDLLAKIFEPFFTTKEPGKGTGLGLSTVHGIVSQNEGFLAVSPNPSGGTTFSVYLPSFAKQARRRKVAPPGETPPPPDLHSCIVVEDEAAVRRLLARTLERAGFRVLAAADGNEALELLARHPDTEIVVSDLMLPGMTGVELITEATRLAPHLRTLLISGYSSEDIALPFSYAFLQKPFTPNELLAAIRELPVAGRSATA